MRGMIIVSLLSLVATCDVAIAADPPPCPPTAESPLIGLWNDPSGNEIFVYSNGYFVMKEGTDRARVGFGKFGCIAGQTVQGQTPFYWQFVGTWLSYPFDQADNAGGPFRMRQPQGKNGCDMDYTFVAWLSDNGRFDTGPGADLDDVTLKPAHGQKTPEKKKQRDDPPPANLPELGVSREWQVMQVTPANNQHLQRGDFLQGPGTSFGRLGTTSEERLILVLGIITQSDRGQGTVVPATVGLGVDVKNQCAVRVSVTFVSANSITGTLMFEADEPDIEFSAFRVGSK